MILILEDYQLKLLKTILNNEISLRKFGEYHPKDTEEVKKLLKIVDSVINRKSIKYTNGKEL